MSESSENDDILTPEELKTTVNNAQLSFLPEKSREKYLKAYEIFNKWRSEKGAKTFSETVLLSYFIELAQTKQSSTMWSIYSMLKATIKTKKDVHIEKYPKLIAFLKRTSVGHKSKKSKIFMASEIDKFITEAPDCNFLAAKVILVIGINGACRTNELLNMTVNDIEKHSETLILVNLPNTKTNIDRSFVIRDEYVQIIEKYEALRPTNTKTNRFFLQYQNGKCTRQPMGVNKIGGTPREIATYLKLQEPSLYTGHCFRRTSATLLADSGADLTTLKRHGGWKSNTVAEGYIEDSIENKSKICQRIAETINLKQTSDTRSCSGTSSEINKNQTNPIRMKQSTDPWSQPGTSKSSMLKQTSDPWSRPCFSKETNTESGSIMFKQSSDPWSRPGTSRKAFESQAKPKLITSTSTNTESRSESPTFTVFPSQSESEASATTQPQVANTTITLPNKTININLQNCNNWTLNL